VGKAVSGIFGIFDRNGKPVDKDVIDSMLDTMSTWKPDAHGVLLDGPMAFGHTMLWNTPESRLENLPRTQNHLTITMDARLDNREDLAVQLDLSSNSLEEVRDSDLILAAYTKWGESCPKYLLGDFAFAIWDDEKRQFFCARDHVGIKQFYYYLSSDLFVFSNHISGFKTHPDIADTPDDSTIAYYLRDIDHRLEQTFFKSVKRLSPATSMLIKADKVSRLVYWKPEDSPAISMESEAEYVNLLRTMLEKSVSARLRSDFVVSSHLSGGLDSSAIAAIAGRQLKQVNHPLHVYNWISEPQTDGTDPEYFEWRYSKLLAGKEGLIHHSVPLDESTLTDIFLSHDIATNDTVDLWYEFPIRKRVRENGGRTLLSGWGGDELVSFGGRGYLAELLFSGRIKKCFATFKKYPNIKSRNYTFFQSINQFIRRIVAESFPLSVLYLLKKSYCYETLPVNFSPSEFTTFADKLKSLYKGYNSTSIRNRQLKMFRHGHIQSRIESWATSGMSDRIEYAYPLLDKRLIEFALGIPADLYTNDRSDRFIFREALKEILPDKIRLHTQKGEPHRVGLFHKLTLNALKTTANNAEKHDNHPYILKDSLFATINALHSNTLTGNQRCTDSLECAARSFFVYNSRTLKKPK
jgi:asparagine synthase (glutamine-hydrolysing)